MTRISRTPAAAPTTRPAAQTHPSAPLPVQGRGIGAGIRTTLGETGIRIFPLILGSAEFGWTVGQVDSGHVLDRYVRHGGNTVHTADSSAGGRSEHIVGRWLRSRRLRDEIVVTSRIGRHPDHPGLESVNLVRAVEASLTRLGTDRIDVLYLDAAGADPVPLEDALATAEWLIDAGKVRSVGAYGLDATQLVEARILSSAGYPRIDALDVAYNVMRRAEAEGDVRLIVETQGIALTPSHPLEHGFLSGRPGRSMGRARGRKRRISRRGSRMLGALDRVAGELDVPPAAVAMAWLLARRAVAAPIVNAFEPEHVDELVQGIGVRLGRVHLAELARA